MSALNVYTPERYDERVWHLALGIEPRDALTGLRLPGGVDVRREVFPEPVGDWRAWRPGDTLTRHLPRMPRHRGGRFAIRYDEGATTGNDLRVVDDATAPHRPGEGRRIVPRRVRVTISSEATVLAAEADPALPPHPQWRRTFPLWCFPGADAPLPSRSTVLRGLVVRQPGGAGTPLLPVRWARVRARNSAGADVGWAHGDDRGEFVLVVHAADGDVVVPTDPVAVDLTVGAVLPPPAPDVADPARAVVDPLWDLPLETLTLDADPAAQTSLTGRRFLPAQVQRVPLDPPLPVALPLGRETSIVIRISD